MYVRKNILIYIFKILFEEDTFQKLLSQWLMTLPKAMTTASTCVYAVVNHCLLPIGFKSWAVQFEVWNCRKKFIEVANLTMTFNMTDQRLNSRQSTKWNNGKTKISISLKINNKKEIGCIKIHFYYTDLINKNFQRI